MALSIKDIKTKLGGFFQRKLKNLITLGNDSTLESDLKPIKVGDNNTPIEVSETEVRVSGTINADAINVSKSGLLYDGTGLKMRKTSDASADTTGYGQIWVNDRTPNELAFTDDAGTDIIGIGKYHYETKFIAFNATSASIYFPMNGYIIEGTSTSGRNEYQSFLAPYNGTIEKVAFRTEIAQDGTFSLRVLESSDATEIPGTIIFRKDETIDIADDIYYEYSLTSPSVGSDYCPLTKGRIYMIYFTFASTPYDTNVNMVFKWDITS